MIPLISKDVRVYVYVQVVLGLLLACGEEREAPKPRLASERLGAEREEKAPGWATEAGKSLAKGMQLGAAGRVQPTAADRAYETTEPVAIRRVVYRFAIDVPPAMREAHPPLLPTSGELHLDVGEERLRAKFHGQAWPIDEGTELRLRSDMPGVYLYDGAGGRPLARNHLASWFLGDELATFRRVALTIRRDPGPSAEGPAELVCALLAEWTASPREETMRQCSGGALPLGFRFGIWNADLTAIVPMSVPRSQLRADTIGLPKSFSSSRMRPLRDARELSKLTPKKFPDLAPIAGPPGSGTLRVVNHGSARTLVVVSGVPVGWLQPEAAAEFHGWNPGHYRVGWLRPYAQFALLPAPIAIPGELSLGLTPIEPPPPPQLDSPRSSDSPEATR